MESTLGAGVSVKCLFQLLALLGVTHQQVADLLHTSRPNVTMWARGKQPMPRKHVEALERFTWDALRRKYDTYIQAMDDALGEDGWKVFVKGADAAHEPLLFKTPPPDAPPVVQQWWDFHVRSLQLMDDWEVELHQARHVERTKALIREVGKLAVAEGDKLDAMIEGPDRHQLLDCVGELHTLLQGLERIDARPIVTRLRTALQPRRPVPA
jgi:hypothetical protein